MKRASWYLALIMMIVTLALSGCSSTSKRDSDAAAVEDRSATDTQSGMGTETDTQTHGIADSTDWRGAPLDDPSSPLSVRTLYFEYDSSEVQAQYRSAVQAHAAYLAANPGVVVTLEGHADERGSREYNLALGERRANAVRRQFVLLGASAGQIRSTSYGEERPAVDGHDEAAWSANRRVEILY